MNLPAKALPSANSTGEPYVTGNFSPLMNEVTAFNLEVIGHVPEALNGRFLRIGTNPVDEPHPLWLIGHHWFAGAGMAHGLRLRDGKAEWFRSRFVVDERTARVRRIKVAGPAPPWAAWSLRSERRRCGQHWLAARGFRPACLVLPRSLC